MEDCTAAAAVLKSKCRSLWGVESRRLRAAGHRSALAYGPRGPAIGAPSARSCDTDPVGPDSLDVDALLGSTAAFRTGGRDPADVLVAAGVNRTSDQDLVAAVRAALHAQPDLIEVWQGWSYDKRWSPSPYLEELEVGHYDAGKQSVRNHTNPIDACADFVLAEVRWIVDRRVVGSS